MGKEEGSGSVSMICAPSIGGATQGELKQFRLLETHCRQGLVLFLWRLFCPLSNGLFWLCLIFFLGAATIKELTTSIKISSEGIYLTLSSVGFHLYNLFSYLSLSCSLTLYLFHSLCSPFSRLSYGTYWKSYKEVGITPANHPSIHLTKI